MAWRSLTGAPMHREWIDLADIAPVMARSVVAAEDANFCLHWGFDMAEIRKAMAGGGNRGASTLTQQVVKNLFFGTGRSILRKGAEASRGPVAECVLGKRRILELYLNIVEWGPGVYGADAACRYYYRVPARAVGREQAARLAAILPAPRRRRPERMNSYSGVILRRMSRTGW
jgi:monofunctional biosynthetic peptidoglycan transglycosylase